MPPMYQRSYRDCRGGGIKWHGKGYRERGELYVQLKRAYFAEPFSRGHAVNEHATMAEFWSDLYRDLSMEDGFPLPDGLFLEFQAFRGKRLDGSDDMVGQHFEGGEMVHAKVFDADGRQYILHYNGGFRWQMK